MNSTDHVILIVGAGPSGLALATELLRRHILFAIIDKATGPAPLHESRALAFNARSQHILAPSGITPHIKHAAHPVERVHLCWQSQLSHALTLKTDDNPNELLVIRQGQVEREMLTHLNDQGIEVQWCTELLEFTETDDRIVATVRNELGETHSVAAQYLIGCDGAHSAVRKKGGYTFDGESDAQSWTLADISVSDNRFAHTLTADLSRGKAFATIPINEELVRLIHNGPDLFNQHPHAPLCTDIHWQSEFNVSYRLVKQYNRGLTFLCGDAAHIHSPVGGRGMNLGIEDAATLAWLLSEGREIEYSSLRRPVAQKVLKLTHNQTSQMNSISAVSSLVKRYGPKLLSFPVVKRNLLRSLHGLDTPDPIWLN